MANNLNVANKFEINDKVRLWEDNQWWKGTVTAIHSINLISVKWDEGLTEKVAPGILIKA